MQKNKVLVLVLLGIGLMLVGIGLGLRLVGSETTNPRAEAQPQINCVEPAHVSVSAPELELQTLDLQPVDLAAYRGKIVLLNAWATWCPPCLAELPDLEAYYQEHREEDFVLIGVNIGESQAIVSKFLAQTPLSFPIWLDPDEKTMRAFNTISLPYSIVINRGGAVELAWSGATCLESLEYSVTPLLRQ